MNGLLGLFKFYENTGVSPFKVGIVRKLPYNIRIARVLLRREHHL